MAVSVTPSRHTVPSYPTQANDAMLAKLDSEPRNGTIVPKGAPRQRKDATASRIAQVSVGNESTLARVGNFAGKVADALVPSAVVLGESHDLPLAAGRGGNFALIDRRTGEKTYFATKPISPKYPDGIGAPAWLKKLSLPGKVLPAVSIVGTNNSSDEAGLGLSWKVSSKVGDVLVFANLRQDGLTVGNLMDNLQGKGQKSFTVSVNFGAALSVSDSAIIGVGAVAGGPVGSMLASEVVAPNTPADAWVGAAYRGSLTFENGKPTSATLNGIKIPFGELGQVLGKAAEKARQSPPLIANNGSNAIASYNDNLQLLFGQSPWDVGFAAQAKTKSGGLLMRNGTVDVRNHGNSVTALTEPVYELGVRFSALSPGQRIKTNKEAGAVIDHILTNARAVDQTNAAAGKKSNEYEIARNKLMNPYFLDMGSKQLQMEHRLFQGSNAYQALTNGSRLLQKLQMLPVGRTPKDAAFVKAAFQGDLRYQGDNPSRNTTETPSRRYGF